MHVSPESGRSEVKSKSELRAAILARRDALSKEEITRKSAAASAHLLSLAEFTAAKVIMFFFSFRSELDTSSLIKAAMAAGKRVIAPRVDRQARFLVPCEIMDLEQDLAPGVYDIQEPRSSCRVVEPETIDVVIVPGAVWDERGYRIGYGAGYYDRFLALAPRARRIGLGFELQVVSEVPRTPRDLPVELLVTEAGVRRFSGSDQGCD